MAITRDTSAISGETSAQSQTLSYAAGTAVDLYVAFIVASTSDLSSGVTFNSVGMTLVNKVESAATGAYNYLYCITNVSGTHNIVASISGGVNKTLEILAVSYLGTGHAQPTVKNTATATSATTWAQSLTPTITGSWAVAIVADSSGRAATAGANTTVVQDDAVYGYHLVDSNGATLTASSSFTLNISNFAGTSPQTISGMAIVNAPVAATRTGNFLMFM